MSEDTRRSLCSLSDIDFAVSRIEALERQVKAEREKALREAAQAVDRVGPRVTGDTILALISGEK